MIHQICGILQHPLPFTMLLFDVDCTLRQTVVDGQVQPRPPNKPGEWQLLPHVQEILAQYDWGTKHWFGCCSNQGGVGLGFVDYKTAYGMLWDTVEAAFPPWRDSEYNPGIVRMCPHKPSDGCWCRKPSPWMLLTIIKQFNERHHFLPLSKVLMVGDMASDREAAARAGVDYCDAWRFFGWPEPVTDAVPVP